MSKPRRIDWTGVPDEVRAAVEPVLLPLMPLLPAWCYEFDVRWDSEPGDRFASVDAAHHQRNAQLEIAAGWLDLSEDRRELTLMHELAHVMLAAISEAADNIVSHLSGRAKRMAEKSLEEALEASTEDVVEVLRRWRHASGS